MRRAYWLAPAILGVCALSALIVFRPLTTTAQPPAKDNGHAAGPALPISKVVLFSHQ